MKKGVICLVAISFLILLSGSFVLAQERALEIVYPKIPGVPTPEYVTTGLPEYVEYIFRLAVVIIGLIVFGILIYNGVIYLTSAGNPTRLSEARNGILAGLLGGVILLSSFLIFNTINPQLVVLETAEMEPLEPFILPGIYVCDYNVKEEGTDIEEYLAGYISGDREKQIEAAKKLREVMSPENGKTCLRMSYSGNFKNFTVKEGENTFFSVPGLRTENGELKYDVYEYGIVLHEKDNFGGQCEVFPKTNTNLLYQEIDHYPDFNFRARSFTLFKKLSAEPSADAKGVILYECLNYNETGFCPEEVTTPAQMPFQIGTGAEIGKFGLTLERYKDLAKNSRSIRVDPKGSFFALLYEGENFDEKDKKCEIFKSSDVNLLDNPIGRCGACSIVSYLYPFNWGKECYLCLQSMIVIKGQAM